MADLQVRRPSQAVKPKPATPTKVVHPRRAVLAASLITEPEIAVRAAIETLSGPFHRHVQSCKVCHMADGLCPDGLAILERFNALILVGGDV